MFLYTKKGQNQFLDTHTTPVKKDNYKSIKDLNL